LADKEEFENFASWFTSSNRVTDPEFICRTEREKQNFRYIQCIGRHPVNTNP